MHHHHSRLCCCTAAVLLLAAAATAAISPSWTATLSKPVLWQRTTALGNLIVCTEGQLCAVDVQSGKVAWDVPALAGVPEAGA